MELISTSTPHIFTFIVRVSIFNACLLFQVERVVHILPIPPRVRGGPKEIVYVTSQLGWQYSSFLKI